MLSNLTGETKGSITGVASVLSRKFCHVFYTLGKIDVNLRVLYLTITGYYIKNSTLEPPNSLEGYMQAAVWQCLVKS